MITKKGKQPQMGNNKYFKLNDEEMEQLFNDWKIAFENHIQKKDYCMEASQKFGIEITTSDLNYWLEQKNPTLYEATKVKGKGIAKPREAKPRATKPREEIPHAVVYKLPKDVYFDKETKMYYPIFSDDDNTDIENGIIFETVPQDVLKGIYEQNLKASAPKQQSVAGDKTKNEYGNPIVYDEQGKPICEGVRILIDVYDAKFIKCVAHQKGITIKKMMLDALALYYAQEENQKAVARAKDDVTDIYNI